MATIRDIADACGVSTSVVSYVINNNRPVAAKTRRRILRVMEEANYHPSALARGLSRKRMKMLGVIFSHMYSTPLTNPFFGPILDRIVSNAMSVQHSIAFFTWPTWEDIEAHHATYCDGRCDGLILLAPNLQCGIAERLEARRMRFIVVAQTADTDGAAYIGIDNIAAARKAVDHLVSLGHRRIAMICGEERAAGMLERLEGYRQALGAAGIAFDERLIVGGSCDTEAVPADIAKVLAIPSRERPTAIFFANDDLALAGMLELRRLKISIPGDISVVGFDDIAASATSKPPLTTIRQPLDTYGALAVTKLIDQLEGRESAMKTLLDADFILRRSTGPPPPNSGGA